MNKSIIDLNALYIRFFLFKSEKCSFGTLFFCNILYLLKTYFPVPLFLVIQMRSKPPYG